MGYRKDDCQGQCRWDARAQAADATIPAGGFTPAVPWNRFDDYVPVPGDPQWERYAMCMHACAEVFPSPGGDNAWTTPWPPPTRVSGGRMEAITDAVLALEEIAYECGADRADPDEVEEVRSALLALLDDLMEGRDG